MNGHGPLPWSISMVHFHGPLPVHYRARAPVMSMAIEGLPLLHRIVVIIISLAFLSSPESITCCHYCCQSPWHVSSIQFIAKNIYVFKVNFTAEDIFHLKLC